VIFEIFGSVLGMFLPKAKHQARDSGYGRKKHGRLRRGKQFMHFENTIEADIAKIKREKAGRYFPMPFSTGLERRF